jgi:acetyl-CoA acetyltransferase
MTEAFVVGAYSTAFRRYPELSFKDLTREAYLGVLSDAGMPDGSDIEFGWFGNCGMWTWGQPNIRGQVCFTPLVDEGLFPKRVPIINVEGGCATASMAMHGAFKDILSGQTHLSLAIGVEKTFIPDDPARMKGLFEGGVDQLDTAYWTDFYSKIGEEVGKPFVRSAERTLFMDTYAMQAAYHMKRHGTTQGQIAVCAAKNHTIAAHNDKAQYRFEMTPSQVLEDRDVSWPLTRAMCAPIGDGAAAALICSRDYLATLPARVRERAVKLRTSVLTNGYLRTPEEPSLSQVAAKRAYAASGLTSSDIHVAEVHDATSFCEIYQSEMLGFCEPGEGGRLAESGATALGGRIPINTSGGLVSKGHPVGATGLSMIYELVTQLRGEAGERQVKDARIALQENGGGLVGFEEAVCSVAILERNE